VALLRRVYSDWGENKGTDFFLLMGGNGGFYPTKAYWFIRIGEKIKNELFFTYGWQWWVILSNESVFLMD
jgi:hypothetical protein